MKSVRKVLTILSRYVLILSVMFCLFVDHEIVINGGLKYYTSWNYVLFIMILSVFICAAIFCVRLEDWRRYFYHASAVAVFVAGYWCYQDANVFMLTVIMVIIVIVAFSIPILIEEKIEYVAELEEVQLGRKRAYNQFYAYIRRSLKEGEGKAVLLSGSWGSGKTHCLKYIAHKLSFPQTDTSENGVSEEYSPSNAKEKNSYTEDDFKGEVKICWLNLWECSSKVDAWNTIVQALGRTILGRAFLFNSPWIHKYLPEFMRLFPAGKVMKGLYDLVFQGDHNRNKVLCKHLSEAIDNNERVVLIFDDVERANYEIIKALPSLIDRLSEIKKLIVICAIAKDEMAMMHKKELNQENPDDVAMDILVGYLIKVFDYSFQLPDISLHKRNAFINYVLDKKDPKIECTHMRRFMKESNFHYLVPRQIERVIELLLGIERQFFYRSSLCSWKNTDATATGTKKQFYNEENRANQRDGIGECISVCLGVHNMYAYYQYVVFLIETMRLFCPEILEAAQKFSEGPVEFAKKTNQMLSLSETEEAKNEELKNFRKDYEGIYKSLKNSQLNRDLLKILGACTSENVRQAIEGEYKRRTCITFDECESFCEKYKNKTDFDLKKALADFYESGDEIPDDIKASGLVLFEYVIERVPDEGTDYVELLLKLMQHGYFERDRCIKLSSNREQVFTWSVDHFFHLLYLYTKCVKHDEKVKDAIFAMFDRGSVFEKSLIIGKFYSDDELDIRGVMHGTVRNNMERASLYKVGQLELRKEVVDGFYDEKNHIQTSEVEDVIKELHRLYLRHIIIGLLQFEAVAKGIDGKEYGAYHFYDRLKDKTVYKQIPLSELQMPEKGPIENLMDFVTLPFPFAEPCRRKIMMTSELKADLFIPALRMWIENHGVNSVTSAQIDRLIKKCEASINYWKDDKTEPNIQRNYTGGAEKVKKFLDALKRSQSSAKKG